MSKETNLTRNTGIGVISISSSILLMGSSTGVMVWQFHSWDNAWTLAQFIFLVILFGILVGLVWEGLIGRGKPLWSKLTGIILLLLLLWYSSTILDPYNQLALERFTTSEKTVKTMSLFLVGFAIILGRSLVQYYVQQGKR